MTIKEEVNKEILGVLHRIQKLIYITPESECIEFDINKGKDTDTPSPDSQRRILHKIEELNAIDIKRESFGRGSLLDSPALGILGAQPIIYYLEVIRPQFNKLLKKYEIRTSQQLNIVEFHYSQKIVSINCGGERYAPTAPHIKNVLTKIAEHHNDPKRKDKLCRLGYILADIPEYEKKKAEEKLRNEDLPNINRQLTDKNIPIKFSIKKDGITIEKSNPSVKLEFL